MTPSVTVPRRAINLTPHPIVYGDVGPVASWPPSGSFARVIENRRPAADLITDQGPVPVTEVQYAAEVADLPDPQPGVVLVVSRVLAAAVPRDDLYFPADEVRDETGRIIGCRALARFAGVDPDTRLTVVEEESDA